MNPFPSVRTPSILAESIGRWRVLYAVAVPLGLGCWYAFSWRGSWAGPALGAAALTLAIAAALDAGAAHRIRRWVSFSRRVPEPAGDGARTVDLGVGEGFRVFGRDGASPYRRAGGVYLVGDVDEALRRLRRRVLSLGALALFASATAIAASSYFSTARATAWPLAFQKLAHSSWWPDRAPTLFDVDGDLVKDMIEVRRGIVGPTVYHDAHVIAVINSSTGIREQILPVETTPPDLLGGRVFTTFRSKVFFVRAQSSTTGSVLWQAPVDIAGEETPVILASRMRVYLVLDDRVVLLDAATGDHLGTIR